MRRAIVAIVEKPSCTRSQNHPRQFDCNSSQPIFQFFRTTETSIVRHITNYRPAIKSRRSHYRQCANHHVVIITNVTYNTLKQLSSTARYGLDVQLFRRSSARRRSSFLKSVDNGDVYSRFSNKNVDFGGEICCCCCCRCCCWLFVRRAILIVAIRN